MPKSKNRAKSVNKKKSDRRFKIALSTDARKAKSYFYQYHTLPFQYFHLQIKASLNESNFKYREEFWKVFAPGTYSSEDALDMLKEYKFFIEERIKKIVEKYSIIYWLHLSRRIAPSTMGDDKRDETIKICRLIITSAIQKYALMYPCNHISHSDRVEVKDIFDGLLFKPEFKKVKDYFQNAPPQFVLTKFNENNLLEYYEVEKLGYELWYAGSKSRIISKGANLVIDFNDERILVDDRSKELEELLESFDQRMTSMTSSATATVFDKGNNSKDGVILLPEIFTNPLSDAYSDPITKWLGIKFPKFNYPNYELKQLNIKAFLAAHKNYAKDFKNKWGIELNFVIVVICEICLSYAHAIYSKDMSTSLNIISRAYQIFTIKEFKEGIAKNWNAVTSFLEIELKYSEAEIEKVIKYFSLDLNGREDIHIDSLGPCKLFLPVIEENNIVVDISLISEFLFNLFHGLPLNDKLFKGQLLEDALKIEDNYLPVTQSKALDGTSKQVDFSVVREDILILVECKAVAKSFGIFTGQINAIKHRNRNVIDKGLSDVDSKVDWFIKHPKGKNYDISHLKYIVGIAVSPFSEFIYSRDDKYWLNDKLPRVMNIDEFKRLLKSDIKKKLTKNIQLIHK